MRNARAEYLKELRQPLRMRGPRRRGHEVAISHGLVNADVCVLAARSSDLGCAGWVSRDDATSHNVGSSENLRAVTDRGNRLFLVGKVLHDFD